MHMLNEKPATVDARRISQDLAFPDNDVLSQPDPDGTGSCRTPTSQLAEISFKPSIGPIPIASEATEVEQRITRVACSRRRIGSRQDWMCTVPEVEMTPRDGIQGNGRRGSLSELGAGRVGGDGNVKTKSAGVFESDSELPLMSRNATNQGSYPAKFGNWST